jgi:hypothetical protein
MNIDEINYKHIIGYSIFWIHLLLVCILNFGWLHRPKGKMIQLSKNF